MSINFICSASSTSSYLEISVLSQGFQLAQYRTRCNNRHLARQYCASIPLVLAQY